ncbi:hypothetical protein ECZU06_37730 [Escherichia coli]|nr:hypothetical protein ECZU06_37730 [Escherichia coli]GHL25986.1 hypothetical protein ECZU25_27990 [Escherichia coli]GHL80591.1 hypothetical protein ECZU36_18750 [Escherichia coli]
MTQYWLGLDCGGSWLKAGLYDREGREAGVQRLPLCIKPAAGLGRARYGRTVAMLHGCHSRPAYSYWR